MNIPSFDAQGQVVSKKPLHSPTALEIEFKSAAQVRRPNPCGRHSRADIGERN